MIVHNKLQLNNLLSLVARSSSRRILVLQTSVLLEGLKRYVSNNDNILLLTPEAFDYRMRFRTESILTYPEVWIIGTDVLQESHRGSKFEFSLFRTNLYNPFVRVNPIKIVNEDWLYEEIFSLRFVPYENCLPSHRDSITFFILASRRDALVWSRYLERVSLICNSMPVGLIQKIINIVKKKQFSVVATKDVACKFAAPKDRLVLLPRMVNYENQKSNFDFDDMCLLLAHEKRINNRKAISEVLTQSYECAEDQIHEILDQLISLGILVELPPPPVQVILPTILGKTILRNFISLGTCKAILQSKDFIKNELVLDSIVQGSSEFFREKLVQDEINKEVKCPEAIEASLRLEILRRKLWLLKGIADIFYVSKRIHLYKLTTRIVKELNQKRNMLIKKIEQNIVNW